MPRKVFKRLIKKELEKQSAQIFQELYNCNEIDKQKVSSVTHPKVKCAGCKMFPIVGPRYKCSVCKHFDFCSTCEERKPHDHAFLKINRPEQEPKAIYCVVDDNVKGFNPF